MPPTIAPLMQPRAFASPGESECHGGNREEARNQKRFFHEFLLVQAL
jgi:hypothetical protein